MSESLQTVECVIRKTRIHFWPPCGKWQESFYESVTCFHLFFFLLFILLFDCHKHCAFPHFWTLFFFVCFPGRKKRKLTLAQMLAHLRGGGGKTRTDCELRVAQILFLLLLLLLPSPKNAPKMANFVSTTRTTTRTTCCIPWPDGFAAGKEKKNTFFLKKKIPSLSPLSPPPQKTAHVCICPIENGVSHKDASKQTNLRINNQVFKGFFYVS